MSTVSPLNAPVNINICSTSGTIFSSPSGGGGGGGSATVLSNIGNGNNVFAQAIGNVAQLRSLLQGNNIVLTQSAATIEFDVNDLAFDADTPITRNIPGLYGVNLNASSVLAALKALLYPTVPPSASMTPIPTEFEYGDTTPIIIDYVATQGANPILTISVNSVPITPVNGGNQSGSVSVAKSGLANVIVPMQVADNAGNVGNASITVPVGRKIRVGSSAKDGIIVSILDADINSLTGYYSSVPQLPETPVTLASQYLVITIPDSVLSTYVPTFTINGFVTNAFTLVRNNAFVNTFGYSEPTSVWVSNTILTGTFELEIN
jgi:hypothetical protein